MGENKMDVYEFNKILYNGNINKDFYLYCLRKHKKIIKYFFINILNFIMYVLFFNKKDLYRMNKYKYLKEIDNLDSEIVSFYKEKNKYNCYLDGKKI